MNCSQGARGRRSALEARSDDDYNYNLEDDEYDLSEHGDGDYYPGNELFAAPLDLGGGGGALSMLPPLDGDGDGTLPESDGLPANLSDISAVHTLSASRLSLMSPSDSSPREVAWQFCTEVDILVEANEAKNRFFRGDDGDRTRLPDGYVLAADGGDEGGGGGGGSELQLAKTLGVCAAGVALAALTLAGACAGCGVKKWKADDDDDDESNQVPGGDVEQRGK